MHDSESGEYAFLYTRFMKQFTWLMHSPVASVCIGISLAILWGIFAYRHIGAYMATGKIVFLLICFSELLQAGFFIFRSKPKHVTTQLFDWMVAFGALVTVLFFRPGGLVLFSGGEFMIFIGVLIQIIALFSLNRSFALVPALRAVKSRGSYGIVRHPMYASYLILFTGYILTNATTMNFVIYLLELAFLFLRMEQEEKILSEDEGYRSYKKRVRFRLIPFVY